MPDTDRETIDTRSVRGTEAFGRQFARRLGVGDCVALIGGLGAGKTVFVRGVAQGLGLADGRMVSSPTFVLVHEYPAETTVFHLDLYRLSAPEAELAELGLAEMLGQGVVLIEWADRAAGALPRPRWQINVSLTGEHSRRFEVRRVP